jgi:hypothetical protein
MRCNTLLGRFVRNRMAARPRRNIRAFWSIGNLLHAGADVSEQQSSEQKLLIESTVTDFKATFKIDGGILYVEVSDSDGKRGMFLSVDQAFELRDFLNESYSYV